MRTILLTQSRSVALFLLVSPSIYSPPTLFDGFRFYSTPFHSIRFQSTFARNALASVPNDTTHYCHPALTLFIYLSVFLFFNEYNENFLLSTILLSVVRNIPNETCTNNLCVCLLCFVYIFLSIAVPFLVLLSCVHGTFDSTRVRKNFAEYMY